MKKINELSTEQLEVVFKKNSKLKENIFDDYVETVDFWISDYLDCFDNGSISYTFDVSGYYNDFKATNNRKFIKGLKICQRDYCLLEECYNDKIDYIEDLINKLEYLNYNTSNYDLNYDRLENRIEELIEELESAIYDRIRLEYDGCYDDDNLLDYFLDFYIEERMNKDDYYVNDDFILYEHIEYEKSYV